MDGRVETIAGSDHWQGRIDTEEGPAACLPHIQRSGGIGNPVSTCVAVGAPLRDGPDGKPAGYILTRGGHGTGLDNCIYKVWRNKEKGGRWWFRRIMGKGDAPPPTSLGQSVPARNVRFGSLPFITKRRLAANNLKEEVVFWSGGEAWVYDDDKGDITCILRLSDYSAALAGIEIPTVKKKPQRPDSLACLQDGSFVLGTYQGTYPVGAVFRYWPDRKEIKLLAFDAGDVNKRWDGDALKECAFFGGPLLAGTWPPDTLFFGAVDDALLRRFKDGRVSTLCKDGEWREFPTKAASGGGERTWEASAPDKAPAWGRGWVITPKGYFYQLYCMGGGDAWAWRVGPIDWNKPSVQKKQ